MNITIFMFRLGKNLLKLKYFLQNVVCNLSLIVIGVAIVIVIVVVVVCVKKGICGKKSVGVNPTAEPASKYLPTPPPPPALIPTSGLYQNPLPPIFRVNNQREPSSMGYPYLQPPNYKDSRLPPIHRETEKNISEEIPPSYEPFINQNTTISIKGGFEYPVLPASVYQNSQYMNN
jgi:hypothetical protein